MEESHNPNIEADMADAMQSLTLSAPNTREHDGSASTQQVLDYNDWHCSLVRKDDQWVIYVDKVPTYLNFSKDQSVSLETHKDVLCLRVDDILHIVSISKDGKAKVTSWNEIGDISKQSVPPGSQATGQQSSTQTVVLTDRYGTDNTVHNTQTKSPEKIKPVCSNEIKQDTIKICIREKNWIVCTEGIETSLGLGDDKQVTLHTSGDRTYIQVDGKMSEIFMDRINETVQVRPLAEYAILEAKKIEVDLDKKHYNLNTVSDDNLEDASGKHLQPTPDKTHQECAGTEYIADVEAVTISTAKDNKNVISDPTQDIENYKQARKDDEKRDKYNTISKPTDKEIPEILDPIFPDTGETPANVLSATATPKEKTTFGIDSASGNSIASVAPTLSVNQDASESGSSTFKSFEDQGAIPKQRKLLPEILEDAQKGKAASKDKRLTGSVNTSRSDSHRENDTAEITERSNPGHIQREQAGTGCEREPVRAAIAIKIDNDNAFNFLRDSSSIKQMADTNRVKIKPVKFTGGQGLEISGEPDAVHRTGEKLKKFLPNITSDTVSMETKNMASEVAKSHVSHIKSTIHEEFDIKTHFVIGNAELGTLPHNGSGTEKLKINNFSSNKKQILKTDTPKTVSWRFPGGYNISLCNKSLQETTAMVTVQFTKWNGNEKQIVASKTPDGFGGEITNIVAGLPNCTADSIGDKKDLKSLIEKLLMKSGEERRSSIAFSLHNIHNWSCHNFLECLLVGVWEHFKSPKQEQPVFVEICYQKKDEYNAAKFHCVRLISEMEKEVECLKAEPLRTEVVEGELNTTKADVLVNTTAPTLYLNAGAVSMALLKVAGDKLQEDCKKYYPKGIKWGEIAVTQGYLLPCSYVFHGALLSYVLKKTDAEKLQVFRNFMQACLKKASELGCRTIAFPVLGSGNLKYPKDLVASEMLTCVEKFRQANPSCTLQTVYIVVYPADKDTLKIFRQYQKDMKVAEQSKDETNRIPEGSPLEERDKNDDTNLVDVITAEITGEKSVVRDACEYIKTEWEKVRLDISRTFSLWLPSALGQAIFYEKYERLRQQLDRIGAEVSEIDLNFYLTAHSLKVLKDSVSIMKEIPVFKDLQKYHLDRIDEADVSLAMEGVSLIDFRLIQKVYKANFHQFEKAGARIRYRGKYIFIEGKASTIDNVGNEIEKLVFFVKKLEQITIDCMEFKISKEMACKIVDDTEVTPPHSHDIYVLFDQTNNKIALFGRNKQTISDLQTSLVNRMKSNCMEVYKGHQPLQEPKLVGEKTAKYNITDSITVQTVKLFICEGNLLEAPVACLVNAANENLTHNAGVAAAIANAAGEPLFRESVRHFRRHGKIPAGDAVITTAGNLEYKYVIHAVGPTWRDYQPLTRDKLNTCKLAVQSAVYKSLVLVERYKLKTVAIPAISAGYQGVPVEICALQYAEAINQYFRTTNNPSIKQIHFVDLNETTVKQIQHTFSDYFSGRKVVIPDSSYLASETEHSKSMGTSVTQCKTSQMSEMSSHQQSKEPHTIQAKARTDALSETNQSGSVGMTLEFPVFNQLSSNMTVIQFTSHHRLHLYTANILELRSVHSLVIFVDPLGNSNEVVNQGLLSKGGMRYISAKQNLFKQQLNIGEVVMSEGGESQFKMVLYAIVHQNQEFLQTGHSKWYKTFQKTLNLVFTKAVLFKCPSIAIPVIGTDKSMANIPEYSRAFLESYRSFCHAKPAQELTVHLISHEPRLTSSLASEFHQYITGQQRQSDSEDIRRVPSSNVEKSVFETNQAPTEEEENDCVICLDKLELPKKLKCGHTFCTECIDQHLKTKNACPICGTVFGMFTGNQPIGHMKVDIIPNALPGYETYKTIKIVYTFNNGTQGPDHPEPGKRYTGISRVAYLPDNDDGRQILKLLEIAFQRKLTFTIGQSRTTGLSGVITWNDIHHKTSTNPHSQFGYPDPTYFNRVREELAAKGVTVNDIKEFRGSKTITDV